MIDQISSSKDRISGVSPVIAVILMVAITVTLSGVVFLWATNLSSTSGSDLDLATFDIKVEDDPAGDRIIVTVMNGLIDWSEKRIIITPHGGSTIFGDLTTVPDQCHAGEEITLTCFIDSTGGPVSLDLTNGDHVNIKIVSLDGNIVQAYRDLIAA